MGTYIHTEVSRARGQVDATVLTDDIVCAIEFKLDRPVQEALDQIGQRGYLKPDVADARHKLAVGVSFDGEVSKAGDWRAEDL